MNIQDGDIKLRNPATASFPFVKRQNYNKFSLKILFGFSLMILEPEQVQRTLVCNRIRQNFWTENGNDK
jgi:hypothetical protein